MSPERIDALRLSSSSGRTLKRTLTMDIDDEPLIVTFAPSDPADPRNWPSRKKVWVVAILCALSFAAVFGSSSYAPGEGQIEHMFGVGVDVASLGLTVYVLGFAFGPLLCPLSEIYGRRKQYMLSWFLLIVVIAPSAWVNNLAVILIFRFLAGACSACALNNGSGVISDMYSHQPKLLQNATAFYAFCPLSGPIFGSIVGFFVAAHMTHGLWVIRIHWFFVIALWPLVFLLPETHGPTILAQRAKQLRAAGRLNARASHETKTISRKEFLKAHLGRPFMMLLFEPIVIGAALWVSLAYSIIYFFFQAFPVVFITQKHISYQLGGLPFIGVTIGMLVCLLSMGFVTSHLRGLRFPLIDPPEGMSADAPEANLKVALLACIILPASMFWFAWTSTGSSNWVSPAIASGFFGYSMLVIFYTFIGYTTQVYRIYAASAAASNTLARSVIASIFPVVANPILSKLGTDWGISLFGFLSFALFPIPIYFIRHGQALREKSRFARESDALIEGMRAQAAHVAETDTDLVVDIGAGGEMSVVDIKPDPEADYVEKYLFENDIQTLNRV